MPNVTIDTPDYQRGVVSAQVVVGEFAAGVATMTVPIPPNAETLVVTSEGGSAATSVTALGATSNVLYPAVGIPNSSGLSVGFTWFIDISSVIDDQVQIDVTPTPTFKWFVYADAGVHVVADMSKLTSSNGVAFTTPVAPQGGTGNHPPVELRFAGTTFLASGPLVSAAPAGERYRIFSAYLAGTVAGINSALLDSGTANEFCFAGGITTMALQFLPSGIPLSSAGGVNVIMSGSGATAAGVTYTVETV